MARLRMHEEIGGTFPIIGDMLYKRMNKIIGDELKTLAPYMKPSWHKQVKTGISKSLRAKLSKRSK